MTRNNREALAANLPGYVPEDDRPKCRQCQKPLQLAFMHNVPDRPGLLYCYNGTAAKAVAVSYGFDGDGCFCTKGCGYDYGLRAARYREGKL